MSSQWEQTIDEKTVALKIVRDPEEEYKLLTDRSAAFTRHGLHSVPTVTSCSKSSSSDSAKLLKVPAVRSLAKHLRSIPAAASERRALYGLDSTHLAQLVCMTDIQPMNSRGFASLPQWLASSW